jgi:hypothetical protein
MPIIVYCFAIGHVMPCAFETFYDKVYEASNSSQWFPKSCNGVYDPLATCHDNVAMSGIRIEVAFAQLAFEFSDPIVTRSALISSRRLRWTVLFSTSKERPLL